MKKIVYSLAVALMVSTSTFAQQTPRQDIDLKSWQHKSYEESGVYGVNTQKALEFLKQKNKKGNTLVVAVLDSGVEVTHEDLKDNVWVNPKEKKDGKDNDKNGYIDDIHGWNFIGGKDGKNVDADTLELTRLFKKLKDKFETSKDAATNKTKFPAEYEKYTKLKKEYETKFAEAKQMATQMKMISDNLSKPLDVLINELGDQKLTEEFMLSYEPKSEEAKQGMMLFAMVPKEAWAGKTMKVFGKEILDEINEGYKHYSDQEKYNLNLDFDPRSIVGDDYANIKEKSYGNADVDGPDSNHGTHVSGIIAAKRGNGLGIDGIAGDGNVRIMSIRTVPNGDERDKDVANAIRYAVDNGAKILNMSFGKAYSPDKEIVWEAFKYAGDKGVLLIKAAGNDDLNIDTDIHYPTVYNDKGIAVSNNVITVGSSTSDSSLLKSSFSNYGKKSVDVFAPGSEIYSAIPTRDGAYKSNSGTSMASPVVAGVAALVWSHYPSLTAVQVKQIIMESVNKNDQLTEISVTGGVVDAFKAVQLADKMTSNK
ncbi:MAG: S8 family serine peptidase [Weeksellaceae bacterium]|nr:S8 family serine peptidase [Weeksellaceae bacterium]